MSKLQDPDGIECETTSESEIEALEHQLDPPSIVTASKRYNDKIQAVVVAGRRGESAANRLLDGEQDGWRNHREARAANTKRESQIFGTVTGGEQGAGTGKQVVPGVFDFFGPSDKSAKYRKWQTDRAEISTTKPTTENVPLSHMGLFALLPGEIRNSIYHLALVEPEKLIIIAGSPSECGRGPCIHQKLPITAPGLLSACWQIRHEAMPIFLKENTIKVDARAVKDRCSANFIRALGHHGRHLRCIMLEVEVLDPQVRLRVPGTMMPFGPLPPPISHGIVLQCSPFTSPVFDLRIEKPVERKAKGAKSLKSYVVKLEGRARREKLEDLLAEFVYSDQLADVVYRCLKEH